MKHLTSREVWRQILAAVVWICHSYCDLKLEIRSTIIINVLNQWITSNIDEIVEFDVLDGQVCEDAV